MSTSDVLRLEEYRGRREQRLRRTLALNRGNAVRALVLERLAEIAGALSADRVLVAWIDEYGAARAHPHAVLDLAADPPRRRLDGDLLTRSWKAGVPAIMSKPRGGGGMDGHREWAVSLGSDGLRRWFLSVESGIAAPPLSASRREGLMFLAGECGALLLHQDLEVSSDLDRPAHGPGTAELPASPGAAALDALVDLARYVLDEGMVPEPGPLDYRLEVAGQALPLLAERAGPAAVVKAARRTDPAELAVALGRTAATWEDRGDYEEAAELYELAYEAACHAGACSRGGRVARGRARTLRRLARWDESLAWYDVARGIARTMGNAGEEAVTLDGTASVHLGRGRIPVARGVLEEARTLARRSGDPDARAAVRFSLMTLAHTEGRLDEAAAHGWEAFRGFRSRAARLRALTALGGVLLAGRRLDAAEDAFAVVERESDEAYYRLYALAGLARIQAARGDAAAHEAALRRLDHAGLQRSAPELRAEALLERGDGYRELGAREEARRWYREAIRVAGEHRVSEYLIRAERALDELEAPPGTAERDAVATSRGSRPARAGDADVEAIRRDLGALRRSGVGVGGS